MFAAAIFGEQEGLQIVLIPLLPLIVIDEAPVVVCFFVLPQKPALG
jgi:hypothetical protein